MKNRSLLIGLFIFLFLTKNVRQNPHPPEPLLPVEKFRRLSFEPPDADVWAALKIPFLVDQKFGLADANGKILLEPQFDEIEWMPWDLPVFKAKKGEKWMFYGLDGRQALPVSASSAHELGFERKGFRFDENGNHVEQLISKIKVPNPAVFFDPSGESKSASLFYFLKPETRPPFRAWFLPDDLFFIRENREKWMPGIFTHQFQHGNLKIMDEKGRFGLLDRDGNLLQSPVRNCATIGSPEKILILDDHDRIALRDAWRGWQTDFLFTNIETTPVKGLFMGEIFEKGQPKRIFKIDSIGHVSPIEGQTQLEWLEKLPQKQLSGGHFQILTDSIESVLTDLRTKKELFRFAGGRIEWAGGGLFQLKKDKKFGWADSTGRLLLPVEFDQLVGIWSDRRLIGIKNGRHGLYDLDSGQELLPPEFPYLARGTRTFGRGTGFAIRSGKDWVFATKNLEIVGQKGPNAPIRLTDFRLPDDQPAAVRADFEKAVLPEIFTSILPIVGPNWLHLFRSDGQHIASIKKGTGVVEPLFFSRHEHLLDEANEVFTGFIRVVNAPPAKSFFVRMTDGKIFRK